MKSILNGMAWAVLCAVSLSAYGGMASWMWYPGDFEVYLAQELHERRLEWGGVTPVMWPQYHHYPTVAFRLDVDLAEEESIDVWVDGQGRFILPGGTYGNFTDRHMTFALPKGKGRIEFTLVNSKRLPSVLVKGRTVNSGVHWECEHSTCGTWTKADAADYLTDPAVPPSDFSLPVRPVEANSACSNGKGGLIADFGRERMGFVVFRDITGSGRVKVIYGESEPEVLCDGLSDDRVGKKTTSADMWEYLDLSEMKEFRIGRSRAFRFVNVVPVSGNVTVGGVSMLDEYCPLECRGSFRCDDPRVNRIWDVAVETMRLTSREFLIDGVKRDRWIWSGDAYQSCLMNYYLFGDREIVKRTIRALRGKDPIWRHINTIVDYTFYWFCMIGDYYAYTGDADFLRRIYPDMVTMMDFVERRLRPDGLYEKRDNDWVFVDWAPEELENEKGPVAVEQMLLVRAYASLADAARLLGRTDESVRYAGKGAAIRARIKPLYWNDDRGGLVHALDRDLKQLGQFTRYANIFGIFDGYFDETEKRTVLERCLCNGKVMKIQTPYMRFYELETLCAVGRHESVLSEMRSYWGGMLDLGATTFWELYNPDEKGMAHYAMYGRPFGRSLCHAWGAAPIYLLGRYFLGVEPAAPGFSRYRVKPSLGGLKWMEGDVPTPHGAIHVRVEPDSVTVKGAPNTVGEILAFGQKIIVRGAEETILRQDGRKGQVVDAAGMPVEWPKDVLFRTPKAYPADEYGTNGIEVAFLEGLPYHGKPTRMFCYYGVPKHGADEKVPGMVLVHGGGGSAFYRWVKFWNDRGYAAISMDTCGYVSGNTIGRELSGHRRHPDGGPAGWGGFYQLDEEIRDQWMYHAVADVILSHSFLRSLEGVDPDRIGLTGVSWGGVISCITASQDGRFRFAAPVYGCGAFLEDSPLWTNDVRRMGAERIAKWIAHWDPLRYLSEARIPVHWLAGTNDKAFSLPALMDSFTAVPTEKSLSVKVRLPHNHSAVSEEALELTTWADFHLRGVPLPVPVKAVLNFTRDSTAKWIDRTWETLPAKLMDGKPVADIPAGTTAYYFNACAENGFVVSTPVKEVK